MRGKAVGAVLLAAAMALSACGGEGGGSSVASSDCLTPDQVREEQTRIAEGFEYTDEEVAAKQDEIAAVQAREC